MRKIEVMGSGYARPQHRIDNQDLETILDTSDEWIVQRTGIHSRYVSTEETTSMLAARAAQAALDNADVDKEAIALLIVATLSGDQPMPSTACLVQEQLGMMDQDLMAFDLNAACSGFLFALQCASAMLEDGRIYLTTYPLQALAPGIVIVITVVALNVFCDGVRQYMNPVERKLPSYRKLLKKGLIFQEQKGQEGEHVG